MPPAKETARAADRVRRAASALDARLPLAELAKGGVRKAFPDHWSFLLGEIALYSLIVLLLTGTYLAFFFQPSMGDVPYEGAYGPLRGLRVSQAYASTLRISFDVRGGLLLRQMHHWAALVFVAAIAVHLLRIFFTGAFRRPREVNWTVGLTMFLLALIEGFAGYSLPDDLLSGTGLRTAQGIMLSVPVAGTYLSFFVFGGEYPGEDIVSRLYPVHILLVPGLLVGLVTLHLLLVVHLKHTQWPGPGRTGRNVVGKPFFAQYTAKSAGLFFMVAGVLGVLGGLAQINPVWAYGPYRTDVVSTGAQPDWYVGFLEGALRLMPGVETRLWGHTLMWNPLVPGVVLPGVLFTGLYAYPFLERWITPGGQEQHLCDRPRHRPVRTALGVAVLSAYAVLLLAGAQDLLAFISEISVQAITWTLRCALVLVPLGAFWLTRRVCLALQRGDIEALEHGVETDEVRQTVEGGYRPSHRPLEGAQRHVLLVHAVPEPVLPDPAEASQGVRRAAGRLRVALSRWYYRDRLVPPMTQAHRGQVAQILAAPRWTGQEEETRSGSDSRSGG
ncbi:cytochrome bc complex cytochrome b subunit [Streptomyces sp. NPDC057011]|uniref:cytochrome bc1 complex cytochrome b subunit n=1 Tax=unclassified Streptomyces TaxID=2593676 RepID=UPI003632B3C6